ncbi:MAG: hypothetical protein MJ219_04110 [Mycoplasmoidaceae bacterium]|nr:hypothetical protein [Mycoplasmoidaceae bacterium]
MTRLRFFTVQSNILLAIAALAIFVFDLLLLTNVANKIPKGMHIFKLCTTTSTTITMLIVVCVLTPGILLGLSDTPISFLYEGAGTIYHLINPILAILTFLLFETNTETELVYCTLGAVHIELYSVFYILDAYLLFLPTYNELSHD